MKINHDLFFIPSIMVSIFGFYNIYKLRKKTKELDDTIEIVTSTQLKYMEVQEKQHEAIMKQHEAIKDLYNSIEGIACTIPFTNKHDWQNKMIERKFQRELDRHIEIDDQERFEAEQMVIKIQEDQKKERDEIKRKLKVETQINSVLSGSITPNGKLWDDTVDEDWCDNK